MQLTCTLSDKKFNSNLSIPFERLFLHNTYDQRKKFNIFPQTEWKKFSEFWWKSKRWKRSVDFRTHKTGQSICYTSKSLLVTKFLKAKLMRVWCFSCKGVPAAFILTTIHQFSTKGVSQWIVSLVSKMVLQSFKYFKPSVTEYESPKTGRVHSFCKKIEKFQ